MKSGVRQGCVLSGFIFVFMMDWVMRHTNRKRGLRWKLTSVVEDLDYDDDVALISSRFAEAGREKRGTMEKERITKKKPVSKPK